MDSLIKAHVQRVIDTLSSSIAYEGTPLDTLSAQYKELEDKYLKLQNDHQTLLHQHDAKVAGLEATNRSLVDELIDRSRKYNELAKELKERDPLIAQLQTTIEKQKESLAASATTLDDAYFDAFRHGSHLQWLGDDYDRVMSMIYTRITNNLLSYSGAADAFL